MDKMTLYPWLVPIYQQLTHTFLQGRGHHALLFKTEVGLGTEQLISQFADWLLCQMPQGEKPCHQCKSCLLRQSGNHPDFHLLAPQESKEILIDQVRELNQRLQTFAQQGGNIVVYIQGADKLNEASSNALLKTLEEPHEGVYFLLEAPIQDAILPTIQSRCQTYLITAPKADSAMQWLAEVCPNTSFETRQIALNICHQRPLICKSFLENDRLPVRKAFLQTFWQFLKTRDVFLLYSAFDKERLFEQLEWLESFFTDSLKAKMGIQHGWINTDLGNAIPIFSQRFHASLLLEGHRIVQQTQRDLREINAVNQELMLLDGITKLVMTLFG